MKNKTAKKPYFLPKAFEEAIGIASGTMPDLSRFITGLKPTAPDEKSQCPQNLSRALFYNWLVFLKIIPTRS
jgi:hypothetical protein